jgi:hypothetical protein
MKKFSFMAVAAALVLFACSKNEQPAGNEEASATVAEASAAAATVEPVASAPVEASAAK